MRPRSAPPPTSHSGPTFARRRTVKVIDDRCVSGWFVEDFTLAELRSLYARERLPRLRPGNRRYDGRLQVPTLDEILALVRQESQRRGRRVGIYPEVKSPGYFASVGLAMEQMLVKALHRHAALMPAAPVFVQSFEPSCLRRLARLTSAQLVQLVAASGAPHDLVRGGDPRGYGDLMTPSGLREISTYAGAVGVHKDVLTAGAVERAHDAGLLVHAWTLRDENRFLPQAASHRLAARGPWRCRHRASPVPRPRRGRCLHRLPRHRRGRAGGSPPGSSPPAHDRRRSEVVTPATPATMSTTGMAHEMSSRLNPAYAQPAQVAAEPRKITAKTSASTSAG